MYRETARLYYLDTDGWHNVTHLCPSKDKNHLVKFALQRSSERDTNIYQVVFDDGEPPIILRSGQEIPVIPD